MNFLASAMNRSAEAAGADLQRAEQLIAQALATSPGDPYAHFVKGSLLESERRCEEAIPEFEITLAANRNKSVRPVELSMCKYLTGGSDQEAISLTEQAIRLSPRDPTMWWWYTWIGLVHLLQSRIDEAIAWLEKGRSARAESLEHRTISRGRLWLKGELERARAELAEAQEAGGLESLFERHPDEGQWRPLHAGTARPNGNGIFPGIRAAGPPDE